MNNIDFQINDVFKATTYTKRHKIIFGSASIKKFGYTVGKGSSIDVSSNDDVTIIFGVKEKLIGGLLLSKKEILNGATSDNIKDMLKKTDTKAEDVYIYFAPSLTFFNTKAGIKEINNLIKKGKRIATKGTCGETFIDLIVYVIDDLRKIGIPFENIHISDFDTFDNPNMLYSKSRGDKKKNVTVATLL